MNRNIATFIACVFFVVFGYSQQTKKATINTAPPEATMPANTIMPLVGVNNIEINKTTFEQAKKVLGKEYEVDTILDNNVKKVYATYHKIGVSLVFANNSFIVSEIHFQSPCTYNTDKNIIIFLSTLKDVINAYGDWSFYSKTNDEICIEYKGIKFYFRKRANVDFYDNQTVYNSSLISKIILINNSDMFTDEAMPK